MATTPVYGWVTPAPTNFVTNLPADFETFADAVDATVNDIEIATIMAAIQEGQKWQPQQKCQLAAH